MTEMKQATTEPTLGSKLASTVLVILVPPFLIAVIGLFTGSMALGTPELLLLTIVWVVGLRWVWRPRRRSHE